MYIELTSWDQAAENQRGPLPDAKNISAGFTLNMASSLTFNYPKNGKSVGWLLDNDLPIVIMRINGVEQQDCRFVVRNYKIDDGADQPEYTFTCWGYMTELNDAIVYPNLLWEAVTYDPKGDKDRAIRFERIDPVWMIPGAVPGKVGEVMNRLINDAKARGALPKLVKNFSNTLTTNGVAWNTANINPKYKAGMPLLAVLTQLVGRNLMDARMNGYELILRNPGAIGTDYSVSDPNKVLWYGRDLVTGSEKEVDKSGVFTVVLGTDEMNRVFESEDQHAPRTRWGRRETFKNFGNTDTYNELQESTRNYRQSKGDEGIARTFAWAETGETGQLIPITGYDVGDKLWLDASPDDGTNRETVRIRGFTVDIDDNGNAAGSVSLGNIIPSFNSKIAGRLRDMDYGSGPGGAGGEVPADDTVPNPPTSVTVTQNLYMDPGGQNHVLATVTWTSPTQNSDGSPLIDHYETQIERNVGTSGWLPLGRVDAGISSIAGGILPQDTTVQYRVRAVDATLNYSAWANGAIVTTTKDTTVPGQASTPTVTAPLATLKVVWDGLLNGGGALPTDYLITEVHVSTTSGFTPTTGTQVGTFRGKGTFLLNGLTPGTTYYVRLVIVDQLGNKGAASTQGSASAAFALLLGTDIADQAITAAKIADGAVTTAKIQPEAVTTEKLTVAGFAENRVVNWRFDDLAGADATKPADWMLGTAIVGGLSAWGVDAVSPYSGAQSLYMTSAASANGGRVQMARAFPVAPGEVYYVSTAFRNSRAAPNANRVDVQFGTTEAGALDSANVNTSTVQGIATETGSTVWHLREGAVTVPAGKTWACVVIRMNAPGDGSGQKQNVDMVQMRKLIGDALIVNLTASKITAGTLSADVLLGAKFYTGLSPAARVEMDGTGLRAYDDTNKNTINVSGLDGKGTFEDIQVGGSSHFGTINPLTGEGGSEINADGNASFPGSLFAAGLYVNGESVSDMLAALPRGIIARTTKTFAVNRVATGTTMDDLYEISAELEAGRVYRISVDPIPIESNAGTESGGLRVYYTSDGSRPLSSGTFLGGSLVRMPGDASVSDVTVQFNKTLVPSVTSLHRFLVSLFHSSAGSGDLVRILSGKELRFQIEDCGAEPNDTGIGPGASLAQTGTWSYKFDWVGNYLKTGAAGLAGTAPHLWGTQTNNQQYSMFGFGSTKQATLLSILAGATINSVKVFMWCNVAWEPYGLIGGGGGPRSKANGSLWTHALTNTSAPLTGPVSPTLVAPVGGGSNFWNTGAYVAADLPATVGQAFRDGTAKGFLMQMTDLSAKAVGYYTYSDFFGSSHPEKFPYLKINYTRY